MGRDKPHRSNKTNVQLAVVILRDRLFVYLGKSQYWSACNLLMEIGR